MTKAFKTTGEKLRELREKKNLTQSEVAKAVGLSVSAIAMYELDERTPSDKIKVKLSNFFGKSVSYIFFAEKPHEL